MTKTMKQRKAHLADIQLEQRIKKRSQPLRPATYDEKKRTRDKAAERKRARYDQRQVQERFKDPETKQTLLGDLNHV